MVGEDNAAAVVASGCSGSEVQLAPCSRILQIDCFHIAQLIYGYWSVIFIPLADRLNFNPPDCDCTLITTPFSFLR